MPFSDNTFTPERSARWRCDQRVRSGFVRTQFLFHLLQFLGESLVEKAGTLAPGFAFGFRLGSISGDFTTINIRVTFCLALEFSAQFIFRHSIDLVN